VDVIRQDLAHKSAQVLSSSALPLPEGSPLSDFDVVHLSDVDRISRIKFVFFNESMSVPVSGPVEDTQFQTTLRLVRTEGKARVDGIDHPLEPRKKNLLLALMQWLGGCEFRCVHKRPLCGLIQTANVRLDKAAAIDTASLRSVSRCCIIRDEAVFSSIDLIASSTASCSRVDKFISPG
jgi:hypothetical protein